MAARPGVRIMTGFSRLVRPPCPCFPRSKASCSARPPQAWIDQALQHPEILLIDHANCEKKAAGTALTLLFRYVDKDDLQYRLSRLAREELRHFEQVAALMKKRGIAYRPVSASLYAQRLHAHIRKGEPAKLVDTLIVGAYIEARSCERFYRLAPYLDEELGSFYTSLLKSEARHYQGYLKMAEQILAGADRRAGGVLRRDRARGDPHAGQGLPLPQRRGGLSACGGAGGASPRASRLRVVQSSGKDSSR